MNDLGGAPAAVTWADVESAAQRLEGVAHRTPVMTSRTFDGLTGTRAFFKCENFQRMGAFKFRGAYNALSRLAPEEGKRGVVAFSSGNHAQAVALAGKLLGIPAAIVMPADAPAVKVAATKGYGAEVILYDRAAGQDREQFAARIAAERGATVIPPFDHAHVIAGQGTAAKELLEETGPLDWLFVCCGGGGTSFGLRRRGPPPVARASRWSAWSRPRATTRRARSARRPCSAWRTRRRSPTAPARSPWAGSRFRWCWPTSTISSR